MQGWKAVLVTVAATALLVGQASGAQAADRSAGAVVQQSVGGDHRVHEVTGAVDLAGVTITAPRDRRAYATEDAVIAALTEGQTTASFGLPAAGELQADGSVVLASEASPGVRLTAEIAPPWAKDAHGRSLPTWYALDSSGRVLTQHVDTEGATYPIAADPRLTFGWGVYLNVTGAEAKAIATALIAAGGTAAIVACSGLGKLPSSWAASCSCSALSSGSPRSGPSSTRSSRSGAPGEAPRTAPATSGASWARRPAGTK